ncbi:unnamed protein product [Paramecium octaurelia]|uniref:Uncharacterized protein n=1 Tax=Paramecium octaurelia TaxID=43137 RepID=A0A8S1T429_PAROT|nr:unnamed protein product [Paramecium octaurelia]
MQKILMDNSRRSSRNIFLKKILKQQKSESFTFRLYQRIHLDCAKNHIKVFKLLFMFSKYVIDEIVLQF